MVAPKIPQSTTTKRQSLPSSPPHRPRGGPVRGSKRSKWRALVLVLIHVAILIHIAHWQIAGETLTPLEPSEAMQTLELGYVNAGFILFGLAILSTLVLGRFFCGWACHVVAYQDLCAWLLGKVGWRPKPIRSRLLVLIPIGAAFYMFVWPSLRIWLGPEDAPDFKSHFLTDDFWVTFPGPWIAALTLLIDGFIIVYFLGAKGFCTYGCPYGGFFGLADRVAPLRIRVDDSCEGCGHCTATCTSNVRVHEEVQRFSMVVDPGCMKCLDCVSVCPKGALSLGFKTVSSRKKSRKTKKPKRSRRHYDFTWPEEIALGVLFLLALFSFRSLHSKVPFLMAIGLALITTLLTLTLVRLIRSRDFSFQNHTLKLEGRWLKGGLLAAVGIGAYLAFTAHCGFIRWHAARGTAHLEAAAEATNAQERDHRVAQSHSHLMSVDRWKLFPDGVLHNQLGDIALSRGKRDDAEKRYRRAIEDDATMIAPRLRLADLLMRKGDQDEALRELETILELDEDNAGAQRRLEAFENRQGS